jgi:hypothetical protein
MSSFFKLLLLAIVWGVIIFFKTPSAQAASLEFSPNSGSFDPEVVFEVKINVNTDGEDTQSADAVINFNKSLLSVDKVTYGSFYPTVLHSEQDNKLFISGVVDSAEEVKNGSGTLATISFKGISSGTAAVSFECETGRTDDSNISKNDVNATDILVCSSPIEASFIISGDLTATPEATTDTQEDYDSTTDTTYLQAGAVGGVDDATTTTIPETGFLDFLSLAPKILMGLLFVAIGLVPLVI